MKLSENYYDEVLSIAWKSRNRSGTMNEFVVEINKLNSPKKDVLV